MMHRWFNVKSAAEYSDSSERTFRKWLKNGLPHVKVWGKSIRTRSDWIDAFLEQFSVEKQQEKEIDGIVNEMMEKFSK